VGAALGAMGSRIVAAQVFLHSESPAALQIVARLSLEEESEFLRTLANSEPTTVIHHQQQLLRASEDPIGGGIGWRRTHSHGGRNAGNNKAFEMALPARWNF